MTLRQWTILLVVLLTALPASAQKRKPQNKPYIDLRPMHFGIHLGLNVQDVEFTNMPPQTIEMPEMGEQPINVVTDADMWNPGFSVGVLGDLRLSRHFSLRIAPTMHFGAKHLKFINLLDIDEDGRPLRTTQDMKNTYFALPVDLKMAAERFNNYRPYIVAGVTPMINLASKEQVNLQLRRYDTMLQVGLGCDFYLPFFKFCPELKFCYGLTDALDQQHRSELRDANRLPYAHSVKDARTKMFVLTFYFE